MTGKNGTAAVGRVAIATQFVCVTDGIDDCPIFPVRHILKIVP